MYSKLWPFRGTTLTYNKTYCSPSAHTEIQGSGPTHTNRCRTCAETHDPLTHTHTHLCASLKFQAGHSLYLTGEKAVRIFWQYIINHMVMQYITHHFTEGLVCLYVADTLLLRVIVCHRSLFVVFLTKKIYFCGENWVMKTLWRSSHMIVIKNTLQNNRTAQGGKTDVCVYSMHVCIWVYRHNRYLVVIYSCE